MPAVKPAIEVSFSLDKLPKPLDAKLGAKTAAAMERAAEAAIKKSGKATVGQPTGKDGVGYTLSGKLTVLEPAADARKLDGKIVVSGMEVGRGAKTATINSAAYVDIRGADKVSSDNIDDLGAALAEAAVLKLISKL